MSCVRFRLAGHLIPGYRGTTSILSGCRFVLAPYQNHLPALHRVRSFGRRFADGQRRARAGRGQSVLGDAYREALHTRVAGLDLLHWINDGLMTFFFLLVGLEIKREMVEGQLDTWPRRVLPLIAALGGMLVPALIFMAINFPHPENWRGWAVPTATDIAFALGVLALVGSRVPASLKVFLTSLAIIDDLGAILIIATFYASNLSFVALAVAAVFAVALYWLNRRGETRPLPYVLLGFMLWAAMLFSGIHATLAGVILA